MAISVEIQKEYHGKMQHISFQTTSSRIGILGDSEERVRLLLQCIVGVETPDQGKISIDGKSIYDSEKEINFKPQERKLGCLFQDYALFPFMTTAENIACGFRGDKGKKKTTVQEYLKRYHLKGAEKKYPHQLSEIEQLYTAVARMMIGEPELILLEDVFSGWTSLQKELLSQTLDPLFEEYQGTVLLTSGNFRHIYELCEDVAVFCEGKTVAAGNVRQLYKDPQSLDAARLMGCRNYSRIERLDEHHICALDWEIVLRTAKQVEEDITYVGIYDHCFWPLDKERENCLPVQAEKFRETLTAQQYQIKNRRKRDAAAVEWKCFHFWQEEEKNVSLPEYLYFPPEALLLLK